MFELNIGSFIYFTIYYLTDHHIFDCRFFDFAAIILGHFSRHLIWNVDSPSSNLFFSTNLCTGAPSTNLSARASILFQTAFILPSLSPKFCNRFISIMLLPSFSFNISSNQVLTLPWNPSCSNTLFTIPQSSSSLIVNLRPNMRKSFAR